MNIREERRDRARLRRRDLTVRRRHIKRGERHDFRASVRPYLYA